MPPPPIQILLSSCSFGEKLAKSYVDATLEGLRPHLKDILDPPLQLNLNFRPCPNQHGQISAFEQGAHFFFNKRTKVDRAYRSLRHPPIIFDFFSLSAMDFTITYCSPLVSTGNIKLVPFFTYNFIIAHYLVHKTEQCFFLRDFNYAQLHNQRFEAHYIETNQLKISEPK